jgi:hypothetical protein
VHKRAHSSRESLHEERREQANRMRDVLQAERVRREQSEEARRQSVKAISDGVR